MYLGCCSNSCGLLKLQLVSKQNKKYILKNILIKETSTSKKEVDSKYIKKEQQLGASRQNKTSYSAMAFILPHGKGSHSCSKLCNS